MGMRSFNTSTRLTLSARNRLFQADHRSVTLSHRKVVATQGALSRTIDGRPTETTVYGSGQASGAPDPLSHRLCREQQ